MNNIKQILDAIEALGGSASIEDVTKYLCKKNKIMYDGFLKTVVLSTLKKHGELVSYSDTTKKWNSNAIKNKYLFVSDNKVFETMVDVLNKVFGFNRKPKGAWEALYDSPDGNYIFFARKYSKSKWTNSFSADESEYEMHPPIKPDVIEEKEIDQKLYYIFTDIGNRGTYLFKGVYKQIENNNNGSKYIRVDDRVLYFVSRRMIVCSIGSMRFYKGITADDPKIFGAGNYTDSHNDGGEVYNFKEQEDGMVYGFVETNYNGEGHVGQSEYAKKIILENIDYSLKGSETATNVRVVFISNSEEDKEKRIVGWYDNATVYRSRQTRGTSFGYSFVCKAEDAHLIDEKDRVFAYPMKNLDGTFNFGRAHISYPYSDPTQTLTIELADKVNKYLDSLL